MRSLVFAIVYLFSQLCFAGPNITQLRVTSPTGQQYTYEQMASMQSVRDSNKILVEIHCDVDFTVRERNIIADAIFTWFIQTNGMVNYIPVYDLDFRDINGLRMHAALRHNTLIKREQDNPLVDEETVLGTTTPAGGVHLVGHISIAILMHHIKSERVMFSVVLHELGHGVGMQHIEDPYAVLYPGINQRNVGRCLTKPDIAELCRVNDCTGYNMRVCR